MEPLSTSATDQALAVYLEALAACDRVVVFGDATSGLAERLLDAGAGRVDVWDPDRARALAWAHDPERPQEVSVRPYAAREAFRNEPLRAAGLVVVPDLGAFDDPAEAIERARAAVSEDGVAVVVGANREAAASTERAFDYYELYDFVAGAFAHVRMVGQLAFRGVALVALGEDDAAPAVSVDTQLAEDRPPVAAFVAIAADREPAVDPYVIVELPHALEEVALADERPGDRASIDADEQESRAAAEAAVLRSALAEAHAALAAAQRQLQEQAAWCSELESSLARSNGEVAELRAEADGLRRAAQVAERATLELDRLVQQVHAAESRAVALEQHLLAASEGHADELRRFEEALRERAQAVRTLELEVLRRDQIVRELVSSFEEGTEGWAPPPEVRQAGAPEASGAADAPHQEEAQALRAENAELRARLDALALDLARRAADAQATEWTVAELERRLAQADSKRSADVPPDGARVAASPKEGGPDLDEVEALRRALAQEHEARVRAESGDALAQARAEIARLTVLLEQMAAEARPRPPSPAGSGPQPTS